MRVIAGEKRSFKLKGPKGKHTRPTEDRIKESLFNILMPINEGSIVLDLFAGSGSIGIEFLSRGAEFAYFVDNSHLSINSIKSNLKHTGLIDKGKIIRGDGIKVFNSFLGDKISFDYIYSDPPYGKNLTIKVLEKICKNDILNKSGILIMEHEKELDLEGNLQDLIKFDCRNYGQTSISFYKKR